LKSYPKQPRLEINWSPEERGGGRRKGRGGGERTGRRERMR